MDGERCRTRKTHEGTDGQIEEDKKIETKKENWSFNCWSGEEDTEDMEKTWTWNTIQYNKSQRNIDQERN